MKTKVSGLHSLKLLKAIGSVKFKQRQIMIIISQVNGQEGMYNFMVRVP
jgi:hypothetical protein